MTRQVFGEEEEENQGNARLNSSARADVIRSACREIAELEASRDRINKQIAEVKNTKIKGDLGMKVTDFNAAYRFSKLEQDDRDEFLDALRETFAALGTPLQGDLLEAAE